VEGNVYIYILLMAAVTYVIRMAPLVILRRDIKNRYIRSFLYYVPYVALAVMTFPAILFATQNTWAAAVGFAVAVLLAWKGKSLIVVSLSACAAVFVMELLLVG